MTEPFVVLRKMVEDHDYTRESALIFGSTKSADEIRFGLDCILCGVSNINEVAVEIGRKGGCVLYGIRTDATKAFPSAIIYFTVGPCSNGEEITMCGIKPAEPDDNY